MSTPVVPNGSADVGVPDVPGISDPPGCDLVPGAPEVFSPAAPVVAAFSLPVVPN